MATQERHLTKLLGNRIWIKKNLHGICLYGILAGNLRCILLAMDKYYIHAYIRTCMHTYNTNKELF